MKQLSYETRYRPEPSETVSIEKLWNEIRPYSTPITVGTHSYLPDSRALTAGYATHFRSGSFKERGAIAETFELHRQGYKEAVAFSAGNHATGSALGSRATDMAMKIFLPPDAPEIKEQKTLMLGNGRVTTERCERGGIEEARAEARRYAMEHGLPLLEPSSMGVGLGQGTLGHELIMIRPDIDHLLVPAGYGGLALGCIEAIRQANRRTKVWGVKLSSERELCEGAHVPELSDAAYSVIAANPELWGGLLTVDPSDVGAMIAHEDAVRAGDYEAMGHAADKDFPEATALLGAAAAHKYFQDLGGNVATLITGSNADPAKLDTLHDRHLQRQKLFSTPGRSFHIASGYQLRRHAA